MAINKQILNDYYGLKQEIEILQERKYRYGRKIKNIEKRIAEIEDGHTVKDKVRGGEGGWQSFVIEGVPYDEYDDRKNQLYIAQKVFLGIEIQLEAQETELILKTKEVEKFILEIEDSLTRQIIGLRVLNGLQWQEVADRIGGMNTESSVRQIYHRFVDQKA